MPFRGIEDATLCWIWYYVKFRLPILFKGLSCEEADDLLAYAKQRLFDCYLWIFTFVSLLNFSYLLKCISYLFLRIQFHSSKWAFTYIKDAMLTQPINKLTTVGGNGILKISSQANVGFLEIFIGRESGVFNNWKKKISRGKYHYYYSYCKYLVIDVKIRAL